MLVHQAFRFELDPNNQARSALSSHAGAARFAYNWGLATVIEATAASAAWSQTGTSTRPATWPASSRSSPTVAGYREWPGSRSGRCPGEGEVHGLAQVLLASRRHQPSRAGQDRHRHPATGGSGASLHRKCQMRQNFGTGPEPMPTAESIKEGARA